MQESQIGCLKNINLQGAVRTSPKRVPAGLAVGLSVGAAVQGIRLPGPDAPLPPGMMI